MVLQYDKDGNLLNKFYGISEASRESGLPIQNISKVCKGKRNSAGGFIWRYEKEFIPLGTPISCQKTINNVTKIIHKKKQKSNE